MHIKSYSNRYATANMQLQRICNYKQISTYKYASKICSYEYKHYAKIPITASTIIQFHYMLH